MARRSPNKARQQVSPTARREIPASSFAVKFQWFLASAWMPAFLAAITFLVYVPSLYSGLVSDARMEIEEGFVTSLSNLPQVLTLKVLGMHLILADRPGEMLYLMLNAALWGKGPFGFHLASIVLHAVNVALLWVLLRRLIMATKDAAWLATNSFAGHFALAVAVLIFALHPIAAESVAEVSFSSSLLVTFFTLLALLAATVFRPDQKRVAFLAAIAGLLCVFAAVLTKESGLAIALLLIVYWFLYRRSEPGEPWVLFLGSAMAVTVIVIGAILTFAVTRQLNLTYLGGSFGQVFLIQPKIWVFMMGQLLWPTNLAADYTLADMNLLSTPLAIVVLGVVMVLQAWLARRSRIGALGVAVYWLGLATVSNFVPLFCITADRFYYLPLAGVAMQLVALLLLISRSRRAYGIVIGALIVALPFLACLTVVRQGVFANEEALWGDTLKKSPHSSLANANLGETLFREGRLSEAVVHYAKAAELDPTNPCFPDSLGFVDTQLGKPEEAVTEFHAALAIDPQYGEAHCNLGVALCRLGQFDDGIKEFHEALALDPGDVEAHTDLGMALAEQGQPGQAIDEFQLALKIDPDSYDAAYELGNVFVQQGQPGQAITQFQKALKIKPNAYEATVNLGVAFMHDGQLEQAIYEFNQALALRADADDTRVDLGVALAQKGDIYAATAQFQEALRLNPNNEAAKINLAKAQASASGR